MTVTDAEIAFYQSIIANPGKASLSDLRYAFYIGVLNGDIVLGGGGGGTGGTPDDNTVTSAKIVDGSITNADINAAADIAQSKILGLVTALADKAALASPAFTGTPTAPTQTAGNNSTRLATTAFVQAALTALLNGAPAALDTLDELAAALGDDGNFAATITTALGGKAPLASPAFTGNPTAPTPATSDNDTSVATTAYVKANMALKVGSPNASVSNMELYPSVGDLPNPGVVGTLYFVDSV